MGDGVLIIRKLRRLFDVAFGAEPYTDGDVVTYDAGTDKFILATPVSGGGGPPTGAAGGDLSGTYPNPDIAANAVGAAELADDAVDTAAIANGAVTAAKVAADVATQAELDAVAAASVNDGDAAGGVLAGTYPNPSFAADMATQAELNAVAAAAVIDGDAAGGVLAGTYPNPSFADDMATQAELDALGVAATAADAAIVAGAVNDGDPAGGVLDGTYPEPGLAASVAGAGLAETTNVLSVNVDGATIEISADALRVKDGGITAAKVAADVATQAELDAHVNDASDAHDASAISFSPTGTIAATDVQAAIAEVASEAGGGGSALTVKEEGAVIDATVTAIDFLGADFDVSESPEDEVNVAISAAIARQSALDDHINDATDAHDASAVSVDSTNLSGTGTTVQASLEELDNLLDDHSARHENGGADEISIAGLDGVSTELAAHLADATDAHDASAVSVDSTNLSGTGTTVQASLEELDNLLDDHSARHENGGADEISIAGLDGTPTELTNHLNDTSDAHDASAISFTPAGTIAATDVQAAIEEVASEAGGGGSQTLRHPVITWPTRPDDTGEAFFEPASLNFGSNDLTRRLVLALGSALAAAPTVKHGIYGAFVVPHDYDAGATLVIEWSATVTSGDVVFDFDYIGVAGNDSETFDPAAWAESVTVTDTASGTARRKMTATIDLTDANLVAGDVVEFFFGRDGADAADTMAGRAYVFAVMLEYTT